MVSARVLPKKFCASLFQWHFAQICGLSQSLNKMAEGWALLPARFWAFLSDFPELKAYFPLPETLN